MNDKRKYLTEKDFKQLSLISHENYLEAIKKKEQLIKNLPYSDDILDIENKENLYKDVCVTTFMEISAFISVPFTYKYIKYRYPGQYSHLKYLMNFPKVFLMIFSLTQIKYIFLIQNQEPNSNEFETMTYEEFIYKTLQEKTDMYDSMDSILDLKEKYSLYELNQLKKEENERNNSIVVDHIKLIRNI